MVGSIFVFYKIPSTGGENFTLNLSHRKGLSPQSTYYPTKQYVTEENDGGAAV